MAKSGKTTEDKELISELVLGWEKLRIWYNIAVLGACGLSVGLGWMALKGDQSVGTFSFDYPFFLFIALPGIVIFTNMLFFVGPSMEIYLRYLADRGPRLFIFIGGTAFICFATVAVTLYSAFTVTFID